MYLRLSTATTAVELPITEPTDADLRAITHASWEASQRRIERALTRGQPQAGERR